MLENMKTILFLCTGNSCRSQMAEGFAKAMLPKEWAVYSAGVRADGMNPHTIKCMAEAGVDISRQYSKTINDIKHIRPDVAVTLCDNAKESCPVYPGIVRQEHWGLIDPKDATGSEEEIMTVYRKVRDEIRHRLKGLLDTL
ncbi:MAG: arsenate reductase ArsC [Deltaproteobacteria bacterium]|nr:arsenate reductase ArsC [Deltaproteobacteria bacterium]MBI2342177.1 arsenate reductase ArsC [Deltaproteobacteria bacterium]MBI2974382.1 arsenate reductase ArsC [Deltaproteobacteria bacterium]